MGDKVWRVKQLGIVWVAEYQGEDGCYRRRIVDGPGQYSETLDVAYFEPFFFGLFRKRVIVHCYFFRLHAMQWNEKGELEFVRNY